MGHTDITYETQDRVALITLNRPEKLNAWTPDMEAGYREYLDRAGADPGIHVVVLTGAGRGFCAGADMGGLADIAAAGRLEGRDRSPQGGDIEDNYRQNFSFPLASRKPLLGAINGPAVGLGFCISLYCDVRFASESARFGTAFSSLGLIAEHGISWMLPRLAGLPNALDLLYSARVIDAQEALRMGIVNRVLPAERLLPDTLEYANSIAGRAAPQALAVTKRLVYDAQFTDLARATTAADAAMHGRLGSGDFKEGLAAFAEKRPPNFAPLEP